MKHKFIKSICFLFNHHHVNCRQLPANILLILLLPLLLLTSCQKRDWDNIYDEKISDITSWAPQNLTVENESITKAKLSWECNADNISGFIFDRKVGDQEWQTAYQEFTPAIRTWTDTNIVPDPNIIYRYKLTSFAGNRLSSTSDVEYSPAIPTPTALQIEFLSLTELRITWKDNSNGEDGFKIDRKIGNDSWEVEYGQVNSNISTFTDYDNFQTSGYIYYRVYAYYESYNSSFSESSYKYFECGDILTDPRDGKTYNTVQIGTQCWMAENLNIGTRINGSGNQTNNSTIEKYCYDDNETNCNIYGGLYQWNEMMQYTTTAGVQGICPEGWHIPTDDEWCTLENYVDAGTVSCTVLGWRGLDCGKNLKSTNGWNSGGNGLDAFVFTALPGGNHGGNGNFSNKGSNAYFWSSSENNATYAWRRHLYYYDDGVSRGYNNKESGFSARCLED